MKQLLWIVVLMGLLTACQNENNIDLSNEPEVLPAQEYFQHGVASGDPLADRVIIWTRLSANDLSEDIEVSYEVALSPNFNNIIKTGKGACLVENDFTVKVDVDGLEPNTSYYYRFKYNKQYSPLGQMRTTPTVSEDNAGVVKLAFVSCSNYEAGYFNAYGLLAEADDLNAVIHLGDYIYEYGAGVYGNAELDRKHEPAHELLTTDDYRQRYAQYRSDEDLQAAHATHAFICIWDDHEIANNTYVDGAQNHQEDEGDWVTRREAARKVYYEWMPIREEASGQHYRSFTFADQVQLLMLDTRLAGRTVQVPNSADDTWQDTDRAMLGPEQLQWLEAKLADSTYRWNVIGNQVPFGSLLVHWTDQPDYYMDGWQGYPVERKRVLDAIAAAPGETVFATGDFHSSVVLNVTENELSDGEQDQIAMEFIVPSISSANQDERFGMDTVEMIRQFYLDQNPNVKFANMKDHGYVELVISDEQVSAEYIYVENVSSHTVKAHASESFEYYPKK